MLDSLVDGGEHAEETAGEEELYALAAVLGGPRLAAVDRVHDDVVRVAAEERDHRAVAGVGGKEAVEVTGLRGLRELVEQLGDVFLLVGDERPLRLALVEEPRELLHDVDDGDRRAGTRHGLHVVGELLHRREGADVLHAVFLAGVGDDDELARAEELVVQLGVGDVVRMLGEEEGGPGRHVAHLEAPAPDRAERVERDREPDDGPASPAGARRDHRVGDALVDLLVEHVERHAEGQREAGLERPEQLGGDA